MSGWYKQQRSLPERAWFKDPAAVQLYVCLKSMAYVTDGRYADSIIRRGSCPVTRAELMELTGCNYMKLDRCLKKLISFGEIIVKANNRFSIVTICDYDCLDKQLAIFDAYTEQPMNSQCDSQRTAGEIAGDTTHISTIEGNKEEYLISHSVAYKKEREREGDVFLEIKKRYNKVFDCILPPCIRLTLPTRVMVEDCVKRFGLQSVDLVFRQVLNEPFSLGQNKTGFMASFQYIFTPKNFQAYLERAKLRQKKMLPETADLPKEEAAPQEPQPLTVKEKYQSLVAMTASHPNPQKALWWKMLVDAYNSGMLKSMGIDWSPERIKQISTNTES